MSSGFFYKTAEEKEKLVKAERKFIEDRVQKIIDLKDKVCAQSNKGFVVINQKVRKKFRFLTVCKYSSVFFQVWFHKLHNQHHLWFYFLKSILDLLLKIATLN